MKRSLIVGCLCLCRIVSFSQEDPVVMRINGKDVFRSEFRQSYLTHARENIREELSPQEYAKIFISYQLKVQAAKTEGLDTTLIFRKQQEAYRTFLLESFLTNRQVTDSCARSLYQKLRANPNSGQVQVMQIFRSLPQTATKKRLQEEQALMDSIYAALQKQPDADFYLWVEKYSDDKRLRWLGTLQSTPEFERITFSLSKGDVSRPFLTPEGIHIVKIVDRKELPAYELIADQLSGRVRHSLMSDKGTMSVVERLKKEEEYIPNRAGIEELLAKGETEQALFSIGAQTYTGTMFKRFSSSNPWSVKRQLDGFISKALLDYERNNIEKKRPEMRNFLQAYHDSCLVAGLMYQKVDSPAFNDRAGLATYFKFHSSDYRWQTPRYKGAILHCIDKKTAKRARKMLRRAPEKDWADMIQKLFNVSGEEMIRMEQGTFAEGDNKYIDKLVFKKGGFEPLMSYPFTVVVGEKRKGPDDYREVVAQVREDYRNYLDVRWMQELQTIAKVEINEEVLKTVNNN